MISSMIYHLKSVFHNVFTKKIKYENVVNKLDYILLIFIETRRQD